jgi:RimJ/RimL family protein N-acetyltransferase
MACRDYLFEKLERDRVISWMRANNWPSRRVAERVGMKLEKEARGGTGTLNVVYSMSRADWESVRSLS